MRSGPNYKLGKGRISVKRNHGSLFSLKGVKIEKKTTSGLSRKNSKKREADRRAPRLQEEKTGKLARRTDERTARSSAETRGFSTNGTNRSHRPVECRKRGRSTNTKQGGEDGHGGTRTLRKVTRLALHKEFKRQGSIPGSEDEQKPRAIREAEAREGTPRRRLEIRSGNIFF